jgi:drug/metabolite transporter (DMT)-like permease
VVCSAAAFSIMVALVGEIGPVRTTTVTYVNPAVALIAGAVVLGEPVTGWSVLGFALILAGCYLTAVRRPAQAEVSRPAEAADLARPASEAGALSCEVRAESRA